MKATIEIPDELYRRLEARAAREGRTIDEVTVELYERWLAEEAATEAAPSPEQWLEDWFRMADEITKDVPPGPTAREVLEEDRNRLEPR